MAPRQEVSWTRTNGCLIVFSSIRRPGQCIWMRRCESPVMVSRMRPQLRSNRGLIQSMTKSQQTDGFNHKVDGTCRNDDGAVAQMDNGSDHHKKQLSWPDDRPFTGATFARVDTT